jgi:hypothetical protein
MAGRTLELVRKEVAMKTPNALLRVDIVREDDQEPAGYYWDSHKLATYSIRVENSGDSVCLLFLADSVYVAVDLSKKDAAKLVELVVEKLGKEAKS